MSEFEPIACRPIGYVHSPFSTVDGMPIQSVAAGDEEAVLEVLPEFERGLAGIDAFEYLILITHLHQVSKESLEVTPFLDDRVHGVFTTRAPSRPNRIGLSIVQLRRRDGLKLYFGGNDMLDGTPVLDIKPYVPKFDVRETDRIGWFADRIARLPDTRSDDRMS